LGPGLQAAASRLERGETFDPGLETYDDNRPIGPWLFRIAHNRCIDLLRRREVRAQAEDAAAGPAVTAAVDPPGRALGRAVEHLLQHLPPKERACVLLKDVFDYAIDAIADLVDSTPGGVKAALHRGREKLNALPPPATARPAPVMRADEERLLQLYVEHFNRRDWDGLRTRRRHRTKPPGCSCRSRSASSRRTKMPQSISPDGRFLLYDIIGTDTGGDIWVLPLNEPAKAAPFANTPYFERLAQFSPDGKWVAYASDESGASEIYVRAFPGGHPQVRISASGGDVPRWSRDGSQLFFYGNGQMMAARVSATGTTFDVASATPLFECRAPEGFRRMFYDVMPDGRLLLMTPAAGASPTSLTLTVNWPQLRPADR
jgi:hypothetical protein